MRGMVLGLVAGALTLAPSAARCGDLRSQLLSERAALVAADTPPELADFLADTWDALVCTPGRAVRFEAGFWPPLELPALPGDLDAARDSMAAWRDRFGISVVFAPGGAERATWSEVARSAGLALFEPQDDFTAGDFALPLGDGYVIYRGPVGQPFPLGPQRLETVSLAAPMRNISAGYRELIRRANDLANAFRRGGSVDRVAIEALLYATLAADSIGSGNDSAAALASIYAARWAHTLGWLLSPACGAGGTEMYRGMARSIGISFHSTAPVAVNMAAVSIVEATAEADWGVPFPVDLPAGQRITVPVQLLPRTAGSDMAIEGRFEYRGFRFTRRLPLDVTVIEPLELAFDPPILRFSPDASPGDANLSNRVVQGTLTARNRSDAALEFGLDWSAEDPVTVSATDRRVTLAAAEVRPVSFTISAPSGLKAGDYHFGARARGAAGLDVTVRAALWGGEAAVEPGLRAGVIGSEGTWLGALKALKIGAYPLVGAAVGEADLGGLASLIIPGQVAPPDAAARAVVEDFAQSGHVVLVELTPESARWLPWETRLVSRPGPYAASFYDDDLAWWRAPNALVGGCFAASRSDPIYTLASGSTGWEPLLVDDAGKGFMYRRPAGRGWYVVVHGGWSPRFQSLDRRALLGLVNLVAGPRS